MKVIRFYSRIPAYRELSNMYPCSFEFLGKTFRSSEAVYQSLKTLVEEEKEAVRLAPTGFDAMRLGKTLTMRPDWKLKKEIMMKHALYAKFTVPALRELLLSTGDALLIEASPYDSYWGEGRDRNGQNRMGHLLMLLREHIRKGKG